MGPNQMAAGLLRSSPRAASMTAAIERRPASQPRLGPLRIGMEADQFFLRLTDNDVVSDVNLANLVLIGLDRNGCWADLDIVLPMSRWRQDVDTDPMPSPPDADLRVLGFHAPGGCPVDIATPPDRSRLLVIWRLVDEGVESWRLGSNLVVFVAPDHRHVLGFQVALEPDGRREGGMAEQLSLPTRSSYRRTLERRVDALDQVLGQGMAQRPRDRLLDRLASDAERVLVGARAFLGGEPWRPAVTDGTLRLEVAQERPNDASLSEIEVMIDGVVAATDLLACS